MARWTQQSEDYEIVRPGKDPTKYHVEGGLDLDGEKGVRVVLSDQPGNKGESLETDAGRNAAVKDFSKRMEADPKQIDWYHRGKDGDLQRLEVKTREYQVDRINPSELRHDEIEGARKAVGQDTATQFTSNRTPLKSDEKQDVERSIGRDRGNEHER